MTIKRVVAIIFFIIGIIGGRLAYDALFSQSDVAEYEDGDWTRTSCLGVTYEAPFELSPMDLKLPVEVKDYIDEMENYQFESKPIAFFLSRVDYKSGVTPNIDGAVEGAVRNMRAQKGISDFTYEVTNIDKPAMQGRLVKGTCKIDTKDAEFICSLHSKNLRLLQIMTMILNFPENRDIRDRIMKSVRISM